MDPDEESAGNEGRVLSPNELDLADKDGVEEIGEGRYVVSPDGSQPSLPDDLTSSSDDGPTASAGDSPPADASTGDSAAGSSGTTSTEPSVPSEPAQQSPSPSVDRDSAREWYESQLETSPCRYGYYVSMKVGDSIDHHTLHSDDVTMAFNNLLLWYARNVDQELPPGAVLGVLLSEASIPLRYPVKSFEEFLLEHGMSTDDTIADLLRVLRDDGEVVFPPR